MKLAILTLLCFFSSCSPVKREDINETEVKLASEWIYAYNLLNFKLNGVVIERPPGISQLLFKMTIPTEGGLTLKSHCVYYQVPYKKILGKIFVEEKKNDLPCADTVTGNSWVEVEGIKNFKMSLEDGRLFFDFDHLGKKVKWSFLLPNVENGLIHEKYGPVKEKKWKSGLSFLRVNRETFLNQNNKYLGQISDRLSKGKAIRCQQVDKNCSIVGEDRCDECRFGWYQVVDYNCPQGGSKFCGQNHCGEKGEPACPRGSKIVVEGEEGICQSDLTPVMNADHILICQ